MMLLNALHVLSILAASVHGQLPDFSTPDRTFGAMVKRQGGYYPSTHQCGEGATCAEACGVGQEQCPSTSGIVCFDPTIGDTCCPDGTGSEFSIHPIDIGIV